MPRFAQGSARSILASGLQDPGHMRFVLGLAVGLGVLTAAETSFAYCRTTSCDEGDTACKTNKYGCVRDGIAVVWDRTTLPYRVYKKGSSKLDDDKLEVAIKQAFDAWQYADCKDGRTSLRFQEGAKITKMKPLGMSAEEAEKAKLEPFGIYFRDDEWTHRDDANDVLAATSLTYGVKKGVVTYADIEINTASGEFSFDDEPKTNDFQSVLTHEVGHYLGLAHSQDADSIMVPTYCGNADSERCSAHGLDGKRALSQDDIDGVCALYPHNLQAGAADDEAADAAKQGCNSTGGSSGLPGLAAAFPLAALLRRRRRG
jgi:uncharacterized protein (TIGR03382 family)